MEPLNHVIELARTLPRGLLNQMGFETWGQNHASSERLQRHNSTGQRRTAVGRNVLNWMASG